MSESSVQVKEEEDDLVHMYGSLKTLPASHQRNRLKSSGVKAKGNQLRFGTSSIKTSKLRKSLIINVSAIPEEKEEPQQSTAILPGMKQKMLTSKVRKVGAL